MVPLSSAMELDTKLLNLSTVVQPVRESATMSVKHLGILHIFMLWISCSLTVFGNAPGIMQLPPYLTSRCP
jgi:hypothetical protein